MKANYATSGSIGFVIIAGWALVTLFFAAGILLSMDGQHGHWPGIAGLMAAATSIIAVGHAMQMLFGIRYELHRARRLQEKLHPMEAKDVAAELPERVPYQDPAFKNAANAE